MRFQSTHPRGVRHGHHFAPCIRPLGFNPRTRVGCDRHMARDFAQEPVLFQSTHPRGVRRGMFPIVFSGKIGFQSTHPRGVRRQGRGPRARAADVSIHAPAWGATSEPEKKRGTLPVSIHAPAWGATHANPATTAEHGTFQSTHPRGVRPGLVYGLDGIPQVSIHAPAWGATVSMFYPVDSRD